MRPFNNFLWLIGIFSPVFQAEAAETGNLTKKPNILIIMADDCTYNDLELYGGVNVKTPNIDRLASQGTVFNKAFVTMAMCVPCRAELYTGLYPMSSGVCWNHSRAKPKTRGIGQYLTGMGYRVGLAGKTHINPKSVYQFEMVEGVERKCVHVLAEFDPEGIRDFIERDRDQPFCLVVANTLPHVPWTVGDDAKFDRQQIVLPSYIADTKETRDDFCKYLAEIEELDHQTGLVLDLLEESGESDNTIVIFTSEQGAQWPGCKWTNWNTGVRTAFVVRWPGVVSSGTRTDALIQYVDVLPTLVEIAGDTTSNDAFDGMSFLPVLIGKSDRHREFAYFMHNNVPEGPPYPIRAVTDGTFHYIRNLQPDKLYIEKHVMGQMRWHKYWPSWLFATTTNEHANFVVNRFMIRPGEELYNLDSDPENLNNLIDIQDYSQARDRLSAALDEWMTDQGDPGAVLDSREYFNAARSGR